MGLAPLATSQQGGFLDLCLNEDTEESFVRRCILAPFGNVVPVNLTDQGKMGFGNQSSHGG